ncbi:hypothetical protein IMCC26134_13585 [Verrucomicrobia bacterium IMCC26134]|nr:hypothetical protein IMCC26134_13585 [Verrucomicrobia bacterium IMCC26134]
MNTQLNTPPPRAAWRSATRTRIARSASFLSQIASAKLAGAILLLAGLGATAHAAVATWDAGAGTQDWNTAANWSGDTFPSGNWPDGVTTINTSTGLYPVITANSAFTPSDILIGTGVGATGRLDQNAGIAGSGPGNWLIIGPDGGSGVFNISGGTFNAREVHMARSGGNGNASVTVSGTGVLNSTVGGVVVADGTGGSATAVGTLNVDAGGTVNSEGDLLVAFAGGPNTLGTVNIAAGATVNVASTTKRWFIMNQWDNTKGVVNVNGGTINLNANTDLRFSVGSWGPGASNGPSTLTLNSGAINGGAAAVVDLNNNADRAVTNTLNLNGGTLTISQIISGKTNGARVVNFNGGTLKASATSAAFLSATAASTANVKSGGAIFNSNGFNITVAKALTADATSTGGGLTKLGTGTLTLSGVNTYTGNTTVSDGGLTLPDNASLKFVIGANGVNSKLTGATAGAIALDGDFDIDVTSAGTTLGNSWQIVESALSKTYGATFTVTGFTLTDGKWIKPANGAFYSFDTATSVLSVIADPAIVFPPPTANAGAARTSYAIGSDFALSVSASGTGTLTYQWFFQATAGASPSAIGGATSTTYAITGATSGTGGIYSVVVTDSAAPSTPTTVTFAAISVLPGSDFTLAYYRFEDGVSDALITTTSDSIPGGDNMTVLGTPNYAADSLPYTKVPRTGATNTLGANFPASGNNGLIAPTNGALAAAEMLDFTVEAFVRLDSLAGWQTIVGRDDSGNPGQGAAGQGLFYLSKANNGGFRVELINKSNINIQVNSSFVPTTGTWYHVAAVGDAAKGTLTLYVNGNSVGSANGFNGLFVPSVGSDTPWTLGRGDYAAADVDFLRGDLDEVRFSRAALPPSQFLAATDAGTLLPPVVSVAPVSQTLRTGDSVTLSVTATGTSTNLTYEWYKNSVLIAGQSTSSLALNSVTTAEDATYSVKISDPIGANLGVDVSTTSSAVVRVLDVSTSARAIGLNFVGTSNGSNWSVQIASLAAGTSAGFIPAANWNNSGTGVATQTAPLTLVERSGAAPSYATAVWSSANTWSARIGTGDPTLGEKTADASLLHGYIESRTTSGATVSVANIPYGTYDVYVYVAGGIIGNVGSLSIDRAGSSTYYYKVLQHDSYVPATTPSSGSPYSLPFMIGDATTRAAALTAPAATFVRFTGLSGSDLTIAAIDSVLNANAGGIAAIQIVDTTAVGTPYPPTVTAAPSSLLRAGGASATLSVSAVSNNAGGGLSYQWQKDSVNIGGQTSASLALASLTSADTGNYSVVVTDTSGLGATSTSRSASLVVVDATRSLLINGDLNTATSPTHVGDGLLRADGTVAAPSLPESTTVWNGILGGAGTATRTLAKESTGLNLSGVTFTYANASGVEDNTALGNILGTTGEALERDYLYANAGSTTPMTGTVSGLQALAGKQVTLYVYSIGKTTKTWTAVSTATVNDTANVTLATANNYLASPSASTSVFGFGGSDDAGRNIEFNNPVYTGGLATGYVAFTGMVAADGTIGWSILPDTSTGGGGLAPLVGFQLLVTGTDIAPAVPAGLGATPGNNSVALSWSAASGAATYTVKRSDTEAGTYATLSAGSITGTTYTDNTALNGSTYYYVVAAANSAAQSADSAPVSATLVSSLTALQTWRQSNFGTTVDSGNTANSADPDGDGLANLLEYALGSDPASANTSPATAGTSGAFLTLGFTPVADASLSYEIEASSDLAGSWTTAQSYGAFNSTAPVTYTDSVTLSNGTRRFLRLKVTLAP